MFKSSTYLNLQSFISVPYPLQLLLDIMKTACQSRIRSAAYRCCSNTVSSRRERSVRSSTVGPAWHVVDFWYYSLRERCEWIGLWRRGDVFHLPKRWFFTLVLKRFDGVSIRLCICRVSKNKIETSWVKIKKNESIQNKIINRKFRRMSLVKSCFMEIVQSLPVLLNCHLIRLAVFPFTATQACSGERIIKLEL